MITKLRKYLAKDEIAQAEASAKAAHDAANAYRDEAHANADARIAEGQKDADARILAAAQASLEKPAILTASLEEALRLLHQEFSAIRSDHAEMRLAMQSLFAHTLGMSRHEVNLTQEQADAIARNRR